MSSIKLTSSEQKLEHGFFNSIQQFWQENAQEKWFFATDGCKIHYVSFIPEHAQQAIIISPGRLEGYIKYQELAYELVAQGYAVFIIDHRGQGFSHRNLLNTQKGDVIDFDDFVQDFAVWVNNCIKPFGFKKLFAMGHSMGCVILSLYQQKHPSQLQALAFASPMFGIQLRPFPYWFALSLSYSLTRFCQIYNLEPFYAPGTGNYAATPFADNKLTHSRIRYQLYRDIYERYPQVKIGGPSVRWLYQALLAAKKTRQLASKITIPVLILQAGQDAIVRPEQQNEFYQNLSGKKDLLKLEGAKHELYQEADQHREPTLQAILHLFAQT